MKKFIRIFTNIDWSSISIGTYVRYILMALTIINTILTRFGITPLPVEEDQVYQVVSDVITIIILIVNTYKNNSTSPEAIKADAYLQNLKGNNVEYGSVLDDSEDAMSTEDDSNTTETDEDGIASINSGDDCSPVFIDESEDKSE